MMKRLALILIFLSSQSLTLAQQPAPIADNSFLIEEAYNQEEGVVQHINTFTRQRGGDWAYTFTQEWPIRSIKHQFSFTLPIQKIDASLTSRRGIGDLALNYRYQLINRERVAVAPRFSLLLPTGNSQEELGAGALGYQVNLPLSVTHGKRIVTHWNAGATFTSSAKNVVGEKSDTTAYNLGQSFVVLVSPRFNLLFETVWNRDQAVVGPKLKANERSFFLNPGLRWAHNFRSGLQIVPGLSVPLGVGPSRGERGIFFYLSLEHPFKKQSR